MHGAHKSRNVPCGRAHQKYRNGSETKKARAIRSEKSALFLYLRDLGDNIDLFQGPKTRGRKPKGYEKPKLNEIGQITNFLKKIKANVDR